MVCRKTKTVFLASYSQLTWKMGKVYRSRWLIFWINKKMKFPWKWFVSFTTKTGKDLCIHLVIISSWELECTEVLGHCGKYFHPAIRLSQEVNTDLFVLLWPTKPLVWILSYHKIGSWGLSTTGQRHTNYYLFVGLRGLGVNVLSSRSKVHGFNPGWGRWIFAGRKNPEHKFSGRDFKLRAPSLRFEAR